MLDTGARRRSVALVAVMIVAAAVVLAARSADEATVTDVLSIPDFGSVRADRLANGTPVFIISTPAVGDAPPTLDVIQAFTPEIEGPITGLVAWCAAASQFVDPHHGVLYDNRGRRQPASLAGREDPAVTSAEHTALDDLIHREITVVEGRRSAGQPVVVEGVQALQPWQVEQRPFVEPNLPPASCRLPETPLPSDSSGADGLAQEGLVDGAELSDGLGTTRMVDHSFLAAPLDRNGHGWQIADGWLLVTPDGRVQWCDRAPADGCEDPEQQLNPVSVAFGFEHALVGGGETVIGGPLAVRLDQDGDIARVAVMADSQWMGSSLRGTETLVGHLVSAPTPQTPSVGLIDVAAPTPSRCLAGASRITLPGWGGGDAQTALAISVDGTTRLAVDSIASSDDPPVDLLANPPLVEVEIDAVTCQALAVIDAELEDADAGNDRPGD